MRYIIYVLIATTLFACKKKAPQTNVTPQYTNNNGTGGGGTPAGGWQGNGADKTFGEYPGRINYHYFKTINGATTTFDTAFDTKIYVTPLNGDSITVDIRCCMSPFRIYYQGPDISSGWSFISHPGGTEYSFRYSPATDSATFYYNTYSTTYITPVNASGYSYLFKGKKE